jgi:hypothetical protein
MHSFALTRRTAQNRGRKKTKVLTAEKKLPSNGLFQPHRRAARPFSTKFATVGADEIVMSFLRALARQPTTMADRL